MTLGAEVLAESLEEDEEVTLGLSLSSRSLTVTSLFLLTVLPLPSLLASLLTSLGRDLDLDLDLDLAGVLTSGWRLTSTATAFLSFLSRSLLGFTLRLGILARLRDRRLRSLTGADCVTWSVVHLLVLPPPCTAWLRLRGTLALVLAGSDLLGLTES